VSESARTDQEPPGLHLPQFGERQSLRQQVAHALRAALVAGEMRPGVLYSAPTLAEQFGVSATPVREAMLDLTSEGLVEPVRNKGFRVTELSERDLDEITSLRMLIAVPTVAEIARHMDDELRPRVEALREGAREIEILAVKRDLIAYVEADRRFHLALLDLAGNGHLVSVIANLRARSRLYGLQRLADRGELGASAREHEQILELVLRGEAEAAAAVMEQHIGHVRGTWAGRGEQQGAVDSGPSAG
jgi:DNA-binding GntR family transcriptional regulator